MAGYDLTDIGFFEEWSTYISGLVGFSGDPNIIDTFNYQSFELVTVGQYLDLLDVVEPMVTGANWTNLVNQILSLLDMPQLGLTQAEIDEITNELTSFDSSLISEGFDFVRAELAGYPDNHNLLEALNAISGGGDGGGETITGSASDDSLSGTAGKDTVDGGKGDDFIEGGGGNDKLKGGGGKDEVYGDGGHDKIKGGGGNDDLIGGEGNDNLNGGGGKDIIEGQAGRDKIIGAKGDDTLNGGGGADKFIFKPGHGDDVIEDYDPFTDKLVLKAFNFGSGQEVLDTAVVMGPDILLELNSKTSVLLEDVSLSELQANLDHFIL